jgi:hypothetical protein
VNHRGELSLFLAGKDGRLEEMAHKRSCDGGLDLEQKSTDNPMMSQLDATVQKQFRLDRKVWMV